MAQWCETEPAALSLQMIWKAFGGGYLGDLLSEKVLDKDRKQMPD